MDFDPIDNYPDPENSTSSFISYDYDLDTSLSTYDYYDLVPTALIYGITLITGLIGKLITIS